MVNAAFPVFFKSSRRNSLPMENAIKPKATSEIRARFPTFSIEEKPNPSMFNAPRQYGPIKTPEIKYAVADGSFKGLKSQVISNPAKRATDPDNNTLLKVTPSF